MDKVKLGAKWVPEDLKQVRQHLQMSMKDKKYSEMFKVRLHEHKIKKNCVDIWTPLIEHKKIERDEPFIFDVAPDRKKEREIYSELAHVGTLLEITGPSRLAT